MFCGVLRCTYQGTARVLVWDTLAGLQSNGTLSSVRLRRVQHYPGPEVMRSIARALHSRKFVASYDRAIISYVEYQKSCFRDASRIVTRGRKTRQNVENAQRGRDASSLRPACNCVSECIVWIHGRRGCLQSSGVFVHRL